MSPAKKKVVSAIISNQRFYFKNKNAGNDILDLVQGIILLRKMVLETLYPAVRLQPSGRDPGLL